MPLPAHTVGFGPFQLDLRSAELRSNGGATTKLAEQPFQILAELVEHPGEVVTRDELRQRLWRSDTFVDFEHGLNTAVKRLREVLGDSAESPRYIETIPRRGYRLMVPVEQPEAVSPAVPEIGVRRRKMIWLTASVVGAMVVALAVGLVWRQHSRRAFALTPLDTIVIADFTNTTGDPVFDNALKQGLTVGLEQSPFLNIVSQARVQDTLRLMKRSTDEHLTPDVGRDVCQRVSGKALVSGSIARLGSQYVVGLSAIDCSSGGLLAIEQEQSANKEGVLRAMGKAASELRSKLGESLGSLQKFDVPIEEVTTPSLEALKAYSLGRKALNEKADAAAIPFYERAIELDPGFAMAWAALGAAQFTLNRSNQAKEAGEKAFALRERVSERERFRISALYCRIVSGDVERAIQVYRQWIQTYPMDDLPHHNLSVALLELGHWEEAIAETREELRLSPESPETGPSYWDLAAGYFALNQPDAVEATLKQGVLHRAGDIWLRSPMYHLAFLRGDAGEMERLLSDAVGKEDEQLLLAAQSDTEAYYGRLVKARHFSRRATELELRSGSNEAAALRQSEAALREAEFGSPVVARQDVSAALDSAPSWRVKVLAALALTRLGETTRAKTLMAELEKNAPLSTRVKTYWLPAVKAAIDVAEENPARAIAVLEPAVPNELGSPLFLNNPAPLYPAYLRGQAYLMMHNGPAAVAEFQKFLDHRGIVLNYPLGALAHLQLGRAYAMSGDTAKAQAAYQDFLTLWKDADRDIPILKQAKAEYAKLQ
jgi:DNA-binding winged helix-turn-helix (wHTH) protein/tetratricopeptide (TPR) repeat protein